MSLLSAGSISLDSTFNDWLSRKQLGTGPQQELANGPFLVDAELFILMYEF
jgi:hypothetical protein